jgi:hypothetical protein
MVDEVGAELAAAVAVERQLLDPAVRRDPHAVADLLAADFVEIGASGRLWTRDETIAELAELDADSRDALQTSDWTVRELAPGLALVGYVSTRAGRRVRRTSLLRLESGRWRMFFHQGTPSD